MRMAAPRKGTQGDGAGKGAARVHLIVGDDEFRVNEEAGKQVESLLAGADRQFALDVVDGRVERADAAVQAVRACVAGLQTVPLFGGNRVVWLRDAVFLEEKSRGRADAEGADESDEPRSKPLREALEQMVEFLGKGLPEGSSLVITAPGIPKRSALYKVVERIGRVAAFDRSEKAYLARQEAAAFLDEQLKREHFRLASAARELFLERTGSDSRCIAGEVAKLAVYLGGKAEAGVADVEAVVSCTREAIWWELTDAVGDGRMAVALRVLRQLLFQGVEPIFLVGRLFNHIKQLSVLREALDLGWLTLDRSGRAATWRELSENAAAVLGNLADDPRRLHPVRTAILARQAQRMSRARLDRSLRTALRVRERLVRSSLPPRLILELGLLEMLNP